MNSLSFSDLEKEIQNQVLYDTLPNECNSNHIQDCHQINNEISSMKMTPDRTTQRKHSLVNFVQDAFLANQQPKVVSDEDASRKRLNIF